MKLNKRTLKQIKLLSSNYDFDIEKRTVTIPVYFESSKDMIDEHLSLPGKPKLSKQTLDYFQDIIKEIPKEFSIDVALTVNNYGEYTHSQLLRAIDNSIENTFYYYDESRKKDNVIAVAFIIIGVISLAFQIAGEHYAWFGVESSIGTSITIAIFEILSWVFIWEGGAILFLTYENKSTFFRENFHRIKQIHFNDENGNLLSKELCRSFSNSTILPSKGVVLARNYILFSFPFILAMTIGWATHLAPQLVNLSILDKVCFITTVIMVVLLTIANISYYRGRGPLKNWVLALSIIMFLSMTLTLITQVLDGDINSIYFKFDCIMVCLVLINIICLIYLSKQNIEINIGESDETK